MKHRASSGDAALCGLRYRLPPELSGGSRDALSIGIAELVLLDKGGGQDIEILAEPVQDLDGWRRPAGRKNADDQRRRILRLVAEPNGIARHQHLDGIPDHYLFVPKRGVFRVNAV